MPIGKVYRIGFVGAHNAGKDTLTHHAFTWLKLHKKTAYYISEVAEQALMRNIDLSMPAGQFWALGEQIRHESEVIAWQKRQYVICNRTVIDSLPYSHLFVNEWFAARIQAIVQSYLRSFNYDLVIYLRPFAEIEDDGLRMTDKAEQAELDKLFKQYVTDMQKTCGFDLVEISDPDKPTRIKTLETALELYTAIWQQVEERKKLR